MAITMVPSTQPQGLAVTDSPTFFALTLTTPLTVPNGGTGVATLAAGGVLYGNGAGVVLVTAIGAANSVLVHSGAVPSFSTTPTVATLNTTGLLTAGNGMTVSAGALTVSAAGPHAIGGATTANYAFTFVPVFVPSSGSSPDIGMNLSPSITGQVGFDMRFFNFGPVFSKAASGIHADVSTIFAQPPTIGGGAATITTASTVKITGAPSGATNMYALWVASGLSLVQNVVSATRKFAFGIEDGTQGQFASNGTDTYFDYAGVLGFREAPGSGEKMRLTAAGILAVGTTVVTGVNGGDIVVARGNELYSVNVAGSGTVRLIGLDASDRVVLAGGGNAILWGRALVALGGGSAPTFGTIGGSGPATAAQNTWMPVTDSAGNAFWVPVWK